MAENGSFWHFREMGVCWMFRVMTVATLMAVLLLRPAAAQDFKVDIPYQKFVLPNGLTLLVHEDRKAPIVAVNVWYHVGSKNEKRGKTGFAHLFEHLMFNGSENFNQDYFKVLEKIGATDLNGTTNSDRTNYFQNVPTSALDTVLWMESDRMGHLLGAIDQARLDEQRGVVQNEKRQGENQPYGRAYSIIAENTYPAGHPYSWSVIGSMEDLNAASLEDVREWFRTYYGAANATIVLAGDIDAKTAKAKVERYFGWIPPGPPIARQAVWIAKRSGAQRMAMQDRVPQTRITMVWNTPQIYSAGADYLTLAANVLGSGRTSRLYRRLVYEEQLATQVMAMQQSREIAGQFTISAMVRPRADAARVERIIEEELRKFLREGPAADELQRVKTRIAANFLRGFERIGGFGGKSDLLASGQVYAGNPEAYKISFERGQKASPEDVRRAANEWLSDGVFILEVRPFPNYKPGGPDVDRSKVPTPGTPPEARLPKLQRTTLSNGLKVILAERREAPLVNLSLVVDAGNVTDSPAMPGVAEMAAAMLTSGTLKRNAIQISEEAESLGAQLTATCARDVTQVTLSALKANLDAALALWADVILNPSFDEKEFRRMQKQALARLMQERTQPSAIASRLLAAMAFGKQHPYGLPPEGTEASLKAMTREALVKHHQTWFKPNNATVVVTGDTTLAELTARLEKLFAGWKPGETPKKAIPQAAHQPKPVIYLVDRPGAVQSVVAAGHVAPPRSDKGEVATEMLNTILGGMFTSRINMNLREDKHWTYGARSNLGLNRVQRLFAVNAPVQTDKTKETMIEIKKELTGILRERPVSKEELETTKERQTLRIPGSRETSAALMNSIVELVRFGLPDDFHDTYAARVRALTEQDMRTAAERLLKPENLVWVVVGDRAKIEPGIRELNYGELRVVDANGDPVR